MTTKLLVLAMYDIRATKGGNNLRRKLALWLEAAGLQRVQLSVWVGYASEKRIAALRQKMRRAAKGNDTLWIVPMTEAQLLTAEYLGKLPPDLDTLLDKRPTRVM
jgi:CRISPR-associated endonuclease Cas2